MIAIGVDTGADGALAKIEFTDINRWTTTRKFPNAERGLNCLQLIQLVCEFAPIGSHVWIERNTGRPGEVPDFAFRHGLNTGQLLMAFTCAGCIVHEVSPT